MPALVELARRLTVPVQVIGIVGGERLTIGTDGTLDQAGAAGRAGKPADGRRPWVDVALEPSPNGLGAE